MKGTVLFTKKNALGIYGFIKDEKGDSFYFDTSCIIKVITFKKAILCHLK